uniref:Myc-type, basic helix-loop-helix (BHLH) domain-containing protein n=1 Tax=Tanacetum cinerariifolium TaxID=118510 RepID=A0A6L2KML7_TANCI|nr:Myc-type, basic helix-loop-helix (bHLH) domain-containing protein [Tanacetum cinerariifolium]
MMGENPNYWWSLNGKLQPPPSQQAYPTFLSTPPLSLPLPLPIPPPSSILNPPYLFGSSLLVPASNPNALVDHHQHENQDFPVSWSQLLMTGLANDQEQHNLVARHVGEAKLGYLDNQQSRQPFYSHKNDHHDQNNSIEDDQQVCSSTWSSQLNPVPSVGSSSTMSLSTTTMFDFSSKMDSRNQHTTQYSSQTLTSPYMNLANNVPKGTRHQHSSDGNALQRNLTSRGLCLVPVDCIDHIDTSNMTNNGTEFWTPALGGGLEKQRLYLDIERGFLNQKGSGRGRGVKEKDLNRNKKNTSSGIGVSNDSKDSVNDDSPIGVAPAVWEGVTPSVVDMTKVNVRTLFTPEGNGIDVVVLVDSIRAISKRFANTPYGFFFGKKVAHPVVANYVRNTWGKYDLVRLMFSSSTGLFTYQFSSMDILDAMLKNGLWSSYARVMVELKADVELKDNIVMAMPKITRDGHSTCANEKKTVKKPSQTSRGVSVGSKIGFKPQKEYRHVTKKPNASSSGNKKKGVEPTIKVSNSNPFDILNSVDNDGEFGTNGGTNNLVNNEATSIGSSFMNIDNDGECTINTPIESDSEVELVFDETSNLRIPTSGKNGSDKGYGTSSFLEQWRDSYPDNVDYDPYDDYMYENHDLSKHPWQEEEIAG